MMHMRRWKWCYLFAGMSCIFCLSRAPLPAADTKGAVTSDSSAAVAKQPETGEDEDAGELPRVSLEVARDRARLMHDIYTATLDAMHQRYFHGDRAVVPARAMEDVFKAMEQQKYLQSRWISASFSPMSIKHEPKTEFEKMAAKRIAKGEDGVETIEDGYYRRVGSISLSGGCVNCHAGFFANTSPSPKFAGLVISVPVHSDASLEREEPLSSAKE